MQKLKVLFMVDERTFVWTDVGTQGTIDVCERLFMEEIKPFGVVDSCEANPFRALPSLGARLHANIEKEEQDIDFSNSQQMCEHELSARTGLVNLQANSCDIFPTISVFHCIAPLVQLARTLLLGLFALIGMYIVEDLSRLDY